jgi:ParB-like chromosome segregation protein Spo0J
MKPIQVPVEEIYVPTRLAHELDEVKVQTVADAFLENGKMTPVRVRHDGQRYVLVHGVHRLAACKALGEETITAYLVQALQH